MKRPSTTLARDRLRWLGHVLRSDDLVLTEVLNRGRGRPRRRLYDTVKEDLSVRAVAIDTRDQACFWTALANISSDRVAWRAIVSAAV